MQCKNRNIHLKPKTLKQQKNRTSTRTVWHTPKLCYKMLLQTWMILMLCILFAHAKGTKLCYKILLQT